jgi:Sulfotransferase domain
MGATRSQGQVSGPQYCTQPRAEPMQVLVVGMFRTGTTSITTALKVLGYNVFGDRDIYYRDFGEFFRRASKKKYKDIGGTNFGVEQWESLFASSTVSRAALLSF